MYDNIAHWKFEDREKNFVGLIGGEEAGSFFFCEHLRRFDQGQVRRKELRSTVLGAFDSVFQAGGKGAVWDVQADEGRSIEHYPGQRVRSSCISLTLFPSIRP